MLATMRIHYKLASLKLREHAKVSPFVPCGNILNPKPYFPQTLNSRISTQTKTTEPAKLWLQMTVGPTMLFSCTAGKIQKFHLSLLFQTVKKTVKRLFAHPSWSFWSPLSGIESATFLPKYMPVHQLHTEDIPGSLN